MKYLIKNRIHLLRYISIVRLKVHILVLIIWVNEAFAWGFWYNDAARNWIPLTCIRIWLKMLCCRHFHCINNMYICFCLFLHTYRERYKKRTEISLGDAATLSLLFNKLTFWKYLKNWIIVKFFCHCTYFYSLESAWN